jgi:FkbM family methyltransferase
MKLYRCKEILKKIPFLLPLIRGMRRVYIDVHTKHLQRKYPNGHYLRCLGLNIFCDFKDLNYRWYIGQPANLRLDQKVIKALVEQSEGNTFIDIGAHFGFFMAHLNDVLKNRKGSSTIIALEPDKDTFRCLKETASYFSNINITVLPQRSKVHLKAENRKGVNLYLLPFALTDRDGVVTMYKSDGDCLHSYGEPSAKRCYDVDAICLDSLVHRVAPDGKVAFIKIDIDGSEPMLFSGGRSIIEEHKPIIFMEFAPRSLSRFGVDPHKFYNDLCDKFFVYWVSYQLNKVMKVNHGHYDKIERTVGQAVTDLVLSSKTCNINDIHV